VKWNNSKINFESSQINPGLFDLDRAVIVKIMSYNLKEKTPPKVYVTIMESI
jgi:hypothetical protein